MTSPAKTDADFICAAATALSPAALAVIRASGGEQKKIFSLLKDHFQTKQGKIAKELKPRVAYYGTIIDGGEIIDDAIFTRFDAPKSFTGEDAFEISCHGNPLLVRRILALLYRLGFRAAAPGEFTRRAYLNGKLGLDAAQAIAEIVAARSQAELEAARRLQSGEFRRQLLALRSELLNLVADLNAELDFSDEGIIFRAQEEKLRTLHNIATLAKKIAQDAARFDSLRDGVRIALVGEPNTGKSSLLNRLLGKDRALVSAIPGTTRDYIEAEWSLAGIPVRFYDTAGIRETEDALEKAGIERTQALLKEAQIVIVLLDGSLPPRDLALPELSTNKLIAVNKCDILHPAWHNADSNFSFISAKTGEGIPAFLQKLEGIVQGLLPAEALPLSPWQQSQLLAIAQLLEKAAETIACGELPEIPTTLTEQALAKIAELSGEITSEEVLGRIFSRFCIGK
ncbi:MAG: tRNA uridine-5-carboxymethylaminomethyl(34) synthesis GTPase MnmE [Leptospiraceae bacterium]|nr:tRNA uridine-5-carboxymethylaminomethyl(34) synthesis GTPase MnmE [Leptospiraceae bacterium]